MSSESKAEAPIFGWSYSCFVVGLLLTANILNYVDRTIISVLAESIKKDLGLRDSQLGFLYGTAFVLFNAIFSVAMGRVADSWKRGKLLAIGLAFWSACTIASGFASSFLQLAAARMMVGIGESTCSPCGQSLLTDVFPKRQRATVLSLYLAGVFIGMALAIGMGGWFAQNWPTACLAMAPALCTLHGWQAAFMAAGVPGLVLAVLLATMREPNLGALRPKPISATAALKLTGSELSNLLPPFTLVRLAAGGTAGATLLNLGVAAALSATAAALIALTGDWLQWIALAFGCYALFSWGYALAIRDPDVFRLTAGSRTFRYTLLGFAMVGSVNQAVTFWAVPYGIRQIHISPGRAGFIVGIVLGLGSVIGVIAGGRLADWGRRRTPAAPLLLGMLALVLSAPIACAMIFARNETWFIAAFGIFAAFGSCWAGAAAAFVQDLSAPRMRSTAAATFATTLTLISFALGPYLAGRLGEVFGSLAAGILSLYALTPLAILFLELGRRDLPHAFAARDRILQSGSV